MIVPNENDALVHFRNMTAPPTVSMSEVNSSSATFELAYAASLLAALTRPGAAR